MKKKTKEPINLTDKVPRKEKYHFKLIAIVVLAGFLVILPLSMMAFSLYKKAKPIDVVKANIFGLAVASQPFETYTYSFSDEIPEGLQEVIGSGLESVMLDEVHRYEQSEGESDILFTTEEIEDSDTVLLSSKFVLIGHPYWIKDSFTKDELSDWNFVTLQTNKDSAMFVLDTALSDEVVLTTVETVEEIIPILESSIDTIGIIPPNKLDSQVKLLFYEGGYYLDDPTSGVLSVKLSVDKSEKFPDFLLNTIPNHIKIESDEVPDPTEKEILSLRMTGVTALSRNLAIKIEKSGDYSYPAQKIGDFLGDADFTHTSNEVSFVEGCIPEQSLTFCSSTKYIETLKSSGIDIVELTGNHNNDFGSDKNANSILLYEDLGWTYFGGGLNSEDAKEIKYIEQDGSKIAMIGYNWYDTKLNTIAIAGSDRPGANSYSPEKVISDVAEAKENADIVIVDFQFQECYSYPEHSGVYPICYKPMASPDQKGVFRHAIDSGADIVVGTQAHQPQTFEIYKGKPIFYGLGNIYFDQILWLGTRQGLVLTHYFIDGVHVQSRVDTTIYDGDMIPYLTYGADREMLFKLLDDARK